MSDMYTVFFLDWMDMFNQETAHRYHIYFSFLLT